jgi:hypothetical protein
MAMRNKQSPHVARLEKIMSSISFTRQFLTIALVLTLAGAASARQPPSLAELQQKTERALATCPGPGLNGGYRDMLTRFKEQPSRTPVLLVRRRERDYLVLSCDGGDVNEGAGYRDMLIRFRRDGASPEWASINRRRAD